MVETIVEVQHQVTAEELSAGLNEMGQLITAEYYFTAVASASTQLAWSFAACFLSFVTACLRISGLVQPRCYSHLNDVPNRTATSFWLGVNPVHSTRTRCRPPLHFPS